MPSYHVERSIVIEKPLKDVKTSLKNFKEWPKWSPWIIMEPDATLIYSERQGQVGATYGWAGELIGAGGMELLEVRDDALVMEINFVKPFKSTADVGFFFKDHGDTTEVRWYMDGHLPFYLFWMTSKMETFIGMDYERGLLMLKEYLETGGVASFVFIEGVLSMQEQKYIGIPRDCKIKDIGELMKRDFETLYEFMRERSVSLDITPFSIYHTFDIFKGETKYVACIPFDGETDIPEGWVRSAIQKHDALKTMHKGRYMHLGNAWMTAMTFARWKKIKLSRSPVGYEYYLNNPYETPEEELITEIYIPLR
jgi:effector-binding domain-containing protein